MSRPFNALNGHEMATAIGLEVARAMDNNERFRLNLTYPVVEWKWTLEVKAYPIDVEKIVVAAGGKAANREAIEKAVAEAVEAHLNLQDPVIFEITETQDRTEVPDQIRVKAGLPIQAPTRTAFGLTVETPQQRGNRKA